MTIDIGTYDASKRTVIMWFRSKGGSDIKRTISMMSFTTMVPCLVIAYWLGEETKWQDPVAEEHIKSLIAFYRYTNILNKPPGAPI